MNGMMAHTPSYYAAAPAAKQLVISLIISSIVAFIYDSPCSRTLSHAVALFKHFSSITVRRLGVSFHRIFIASFFATTMMLSRRRRSNFSHPTTVRGRLSSLHHSIQKPARPAQPLDTHSSLRHSRHNSIAPPSCVVSTPREKVLCVVSFHRIFVPFPRFYLFTSS
jgi:hypothetical protein